MLFDFPENRFYVYRSSFTVSDALLAVQPLLGDFFMSVQLVVHLYDSVPFLFVAPPVQWAGPAVHCLVAGKRSFEAIGGPCCAGTDVTHGLSHGAYVGIGLFVVV